MKKEILIILVDGYSTDRTVEVAKELLPQIKVFFQPGKGKVILYGIQQAKGDIIVTLDADGHYDPQEIPQFIQPLLNGYDFSEGTPLAKGCPSGMPWHRWLGNKIGGLSKTVDVKQGLLDWLTIIRERLRG